MEIYNGSWIVYCHTNKINGKMYVGITSKNDPNKRWRNGKGYYDTPHFKHAIEKYGWNNFEHTIVASNLTKEEACNFEILLIAKLNLTNSDFGYNISKGGNQGFVGDKHPMFGKHHSYETKMKISKSKKGQRVVMPQSAKDKIQKAMIGNHHGKRIKIKCVETNIIYESAAEASRYTGADSSSILKCLYGRLKTTHGFHWENV